LLTLAKTPYEDGVIRSTATAHPGASDHGRLATPAATILGSSLAFVDGAAVNVALPALERALNADTAGAQWIVDAYLLTLGAFVLLGGASADRFGRRRVFVAGVVVFTVASVACAAAPGLVALLIARAAQGIGAALLVPASLALLGGARWAR
jgi:MFS family permease